MPNQMSNVSFQQGNLNPYESDLLALERRRKLAEALQEQGMQGMGPTEVVGGWAIPKSPMEGLGKAAQQFSGSYQQGMITKAEREVGNRYQSDLSKTLSEALQAGTGSPGMPGHDLPPDIAGPTEPATPAIAPDREKMAEILMRHPATQGVGLQQAMQDMTIQRLTAALSGQGQGATGGSPAQPGGAPQAAGGQTGAGGAAGGIPMAVWLQIDPTGAKYAEALAKQNTPINVRPGGAVYQPGKGVVFNQPQVGPGVNLQYGPNGPTAAPIPGAAPAMAAQAGAVAGGTAAGQAPYQLETLNTEGAPSLMTRQQAIEAATGQPMPQPGLPKGVSVAPTVTPAEIAKIQDPQERAAATAAYQRQTPGLRLQDQGESSQQRKTGEERAALTFNAPEARRSVADATQNLDRLESEATAILKDPALTRITGFMGAIPNIPGSSAADVNARLGALKSQVGFSVLQAMREASKTGGALGQISDKENELLQRNLAALDQSQSPEAFKRNLEQVINYARGAKERLSNAYKDQYERVLGNQGMQPTNRGAIPTSSAIDERRAEPRQAQTRVVNW